MVSIAAVIVSCGLGASGPDAYVFGGINSGDPWGWTGPGMDGLRGAIASPANFGAGGVVAASASTVTLRALTAQNLAGISCFVAPAVGDALYTPTQLDAIVSWFLCGGDLLLLDDRNDFDAIGAALGFPTLTGPGNGAGTYVGTSVGSNPLTSGPFGTVTSFDEYYLVGHLTEASVVAAGGHVAAVNTDGACVVYWDAREFAPHAGRLVIVTDVDTFADNSSYSGAANYVNVNSNARLALNTIAFYLAPRPCAADLNADGTVDAADLAILLGAWSSGGAADLNCSGAVDASDLAILLGAWGPCS
ncbi:MAG: hypothetical protein U0572_14230 [Phycisphaerales bacterium]